MATKEYERAVQDLGRALDFSRGIYERLNNEHLKTINTLQNNYDMVVKKLQNALAKAAALEWADPKKDLERDLEMSKAKRDIAIAKLETERNTEVSKNQKEIDEALTLQRKLLYEERKQIDERFREQRKELYEERKLNDKRLREQRRQLEEERKQIDEERKQIEEERKTLKHKIRDLEDDLLAAKKKNCQG